MQDLIAVLKEVFSRAERALVVVLIAISVSCLLASPLTDVLRLVTASTGILLLVSVALYVAISICSSLLHEGSRYMATGFCVGVPLLMLMSSLYGLCIPVPDGAMSVCPPEPPLALHYVYERFGRFVLFGLPLIFVIGLLQSASVEWRVVSGRSDREAQRRRATAVLSVTVGGLAVALAFAGSANVKELGLALPGPNMGDIHPVWHALVSVVGTVVLMVVLSPGSRYSVDRVPWVKALPAAFVVGFVVGTYIYLPVKPVFFPEDSGTGIGIIVTVLAFFFSAIHLMGLVRPDVQPVGVASAEPTHSNLRSKRFLVALSFSGDCRRVVGKVAEELSEILPKETVFYDQYFEAELARPNLDLYLQKIYRYESELVVVFISKGYSDGEWTGGVEARVVREHIMKRRDDDVMFICLEADISDAKGFFSLDGYFDASKRDPFDIAAEIKKRIDKNLAMKS